MIHSITCILFTDLAANLPPNHLLRLFIHFKFRFIFNCFPCFFSCALPFNGCHLNTWMSQWGQMKLSVNRWINQSVLTSAFPAVFQITCVSLLVSSRGRIPFRFVCLWVGLHHRGCLKRSHKTSSSDGSSSGKAVVSAPAVAMQPQESQLMHGTFTQVGVLCLFVF